MTSRAARTVRTTLRLELGSDGLAIARVKYGTFDAPAVRPELTDGVLTFTTERHRTQVAVEPAPTSLEVGPDRAVVCHDVVVQPGESQTVRVTVSATRTAASEFDADPGGDGVSWSDIRVTSDEPRLGPLVAQSLDDLRHLLLRDPLDPSDVFPQRDLPGTSPFSDVTRSGRRA